MKEVHYEKLLEAARGALKNSYAPYSNFKVGAAVLTEDDNIFTGANIENASLGLTVCAERVAIFKAVSNGHRNIAAIAISCESLPSCTPCGACRQVIAEFCSDCDIVLEDGIGGIIIEKISELLPRAYEGKSLRKKLV